MSSSRQQAAAQSLASGLEPASFRCIYDVDAQFVAMVFDSSTNGAKQAAGGAADADFLGVSLSSREPNDPESINIVRDNGIVPFPALSDGTNPVSPGDRMSLSSTLGGRFMRDNDAGAFLVCSEAGADVDALVMLVRVAGGGGGGGGGYPLPTVTEDELGEGQVVIDGTILNTIHDIPLTTAAGLIIDNPVAGETYRFLITVTGPVDISWPGDVLWPNGVAPVMTPNGIDRVNLDYDGTFYYGSFLQAFAL